MPVTSPENVVQYRNHVTYEGAADTAGDVIFTLSAIECDRFDSYVFLSKTGAVTVEVSLNATDWSNPVALQDMAGTLIDQNAATTANNLYGLVGRFSGLRVKASGGAANVCMSCWASGIKS